MFMDVNESNGEKRGDSKRRGGCKGGKKGEAVQNALDEKKVEKAGIVAEPGQHCEHLNPFWVTAH